MHIMILIPSEEIHLPQLENHKKYQSGEGPDGQILQMLWSFNLHGPILFIPAPELGLLRGSCFCEMYSKIIKCWAAWSEYHHTVVKVA